MCQLCLNNIRINRLIALPLGSQGPDRKAKVARGVPTGMRSPSFPIGG
jgi:hypothetical protein